MTGNHIIRKGETGEATTNKGEFGTRKRGTASDNTLREPAPLTEAGERLRSSASREEKVEAALEELDKSVLALASDEGWKNGLDTMSRFHHYSFGNQMLIALQNPEATQCAGFNVWKALDRNVIKGEKAMMVLAPVTRTFTDKDDNGEPVLDADGKPRRRSAVVGFTSVPVFDVSQTEGAPLPDLQPNLTEEPPPGYITELEAAITAEGFTVTYEPMSGTRKGYTSPDGRVVVSADMTPASQAKTLAHELGHIKMGHLDRLGEYHTGLGGCRGEMEVEAESYAYVLSRANGMSTDLSQNTSRYLNSWSAGGNVDEEGLRKTADALKKSGERVRKAVNDTISNHVMSNAARDVLAAGREKAAEAAKTKRATRKKPARRKAMSSSVPA